MAPCFERFSELAACHANDLAERARSFPSCSSVCNQHADERRIRLPGPSSQHRVRAPKSCCRQVASACKPALQDHDMLASGKTTASDSCLRVGMLRCSRPAQEQVQRCQTCNTCAGIKPEAQDPPNLNSNP